MYPKRCTWSLKIVLRLSSGKSIGITAKLKSYEHLKYVWNAFGVLNQSHERSGQDEKPQNHKIISILHTVQISHAD